MLNLASRRYYHSYDVDWYRFGWAVLHDRMMDMLLLAASPLVLQLANVSNEPTTPLAASQLTEQPENAG